MTARKVVWLKTSAGDTVSKLRQCSVPFLGDLLFEPDLEVALERTTDRKKTFLIKKKGFQGSFFVPKRSNKKEKRMSDPK